jgi:hypothetical protein
MVAIELPVLVSGTRLGMADGASSRSLYNSAGA